ncbi:hypothetical protein [Streptomyces barringtoniae]|nr:hypothetical protein [Streptomyces barringtoniae]
MTSESSAAPDTDWFRVAIRAGFGISPAEADADFAELPGCRAAV